MPRGWTPGHIHPTRARQMFPELERTPDISRGEMRLAAEVALTRDLVPAAVAERATRTLKILSGGE